MIIEKIKISDLKPAPYNPRKSTEKQEIQLKSSLEKFGVVEPIIVNKKTGNIVGGHFRVRELKKLGYSEVDCVIVNLDLKDEKELNIRLNANTGEWDWDMLHIEWSADELKEWGMDLPEWEEESQEVKEDNYKVPDEIKTDIVLGDLFEIGEHRLLCGDSTDSDQVAKLMNGEKADMVFTDPPYLMDFTGGIHADGSKSFNAKHGGIKNDKMSKEDGDDFLDGINANIRLFTKGAFYICFYRLKLGEYFESLKRTGLEVRALITWNKGNHTLSNSDYMSKCEHIFYGWVTEHNFYGGNNQVDIWDIARTQKNELHPTMKPIPLCEKAISDASKLSDIVLDLFLGSGSTMVASHQLNRKCFGMELDPKYCHVIIDRMIKLDDSLVIKRNGIDETNKWVSNLDENKKQR